VFDGGGEFGVGNIIRSLSLGRHLERSGYRVLPNPLSETAEAFAKAKRFQIETSRVDAVILDIPYKSDDVAKSAKRSGAKIMALDYQSMEMVDVVINLQPQGIEPAGHRVFCGIEYAIIRDELIKAKKLAVKTDECLVMIGGGDRNGLANKIIMKLDEIHQHSILIEGPNTKEPAETFAHIRVMRTPPNISELMAGCEWAVTSGGTTMLEMLYLGKPVHVIPRTPAEDAFVSCVAREDVLLGVGLDSLSKPDAVRMGFCRTRGPEVIDGLGCERITDLLESMFVHD